MWNKVEEGSMEISMEDEGSRKKRKNALELPKKMKKTLKNLWNFGKEDPRRVIHALKVGVSLTFVSLLYLMEPFFKGVGKNALWAVMTVVVVLEFSAGATLRKGLNRGLGTLIAGSLAYFIEFVALHSGKVLGGIFIGTAIFIIGSTITYMRFIPYIKKNYDYGMLVFLLTFNLIIVSSYRVDTVIKIAHERLYTIGMGIGICLFMSLLVFPIWSGDDLHKSTVNKLQGLSRCIEACVSEYFNNKEKDKETSDSESDDEDIIYKGYKTVLDSKSTDEALAMYARWEPRHTRRCHNKFPSQQYIKVGSVLRKFGYIVVALHGCLQTEIQTPRSIRVLFKDPCDRLAREICKVLSELSESIRDRRHCSPEILSDNLEVALKDLNSTIKSQPKLFLGSNLHGDITNKHLNGSVSFYNDTNLNAVVSNHNDNNSNGGVLGQTTEQNDTVSPLRLNNSVSLSNFTSDRRSVKKFTVTGDRRRMRKQLSKAAVMKSLEFSEALPFAAFASLLVEMVARLDNVIDEVEELGTIACFKEYDKNVEVRIEKPVDL